MTMAASEKQSPSV